MANPDTADRLVPVGDLDLQIIKASMTGCGAERPPDAAGLRADSVPTDDVLGQGCLTGLSGRG
jgi:hypothetical protein